MTTHVHKFERYAPDWPESWYAQMPVPSRSRFYRCKDCGEPGFGIPPEYAKYLDNVEEEV